MATTEAGYDRKRELKAFDDTKAGVKGLVDSGIQKIPQIFINKQQCHQIINNPNSFGFKDFDFSIPVIDLQGIHGDVKSRAEIIDRIRDACENWGFFQVINHGIQISTMDEIIEGVRKFHEQEAEAKKPFYGREAGKKAIFYSNYTFFTAPVADWRDSLSCFMSPHPPKPEEMPPICRDIMIDYSKEVMKVGSTLFELISMSLGLDPTHLEDIGCGEGVEVLGHYYPPCPQQELTFGASNHADADFLTILLQDQVSGLQVLHQNKYWVDVPPVPGALVVNMGDLMQLITNDKFKSVNHRVLARNTGPRVSVACFFRPQSNTKNASRLYGPLTELISDERPPIYKQITLKEFDAVYIYKALDGVSLISHFKL